MTILRKEGLGLGASERESMLGDVAAEFNKTDVDGLMAAVGQNEVSAHSVANRIVKMVEGVPHFSMGEPRDPSPQAIRVYLG